MCGIGGILRTDGEPISEEWLDAIDARIAYRGPDGSGRFSDRVEWTDENGDMRTVEVALLHRRMAIIDLEDGHQPMVSERGRTDSEGLVAVVFNGCIYNHRELRSELEDRGHTFVTDHSDTEVLVHGWREWGAGLIAHLEGMYAFAVWDRATRTLFASRDRFGEKPLYIRATNTVTPDDPTLHIPLFAFSSESAAISVLPAPDHVAGDSCRHQWLVPHLATGYASSFLPAPELVDIQIETPGHPTLYDASQRVVCYEAAAVDLEGTAVDDVEHLIEQAVARRLEADVPLGCFLSGGVDSSLIAHFAKKYKPDLMTFSVRMPDARYDESELAETVAKRLGTDHRTLEVSMNPADDLVHLIDLLGQPFGDSSILPTYWVSKAAREHVKVALSGDGGDELFIGYDRYMAAPVLARHWWWLRLLPADALHRAHPKSKWNKLARLVDMARDYPRMGIGVLETLFTRKQLQQLNPAITDPRWACSIDDDHSLDDAWAGIGSLTVGDEHPIEAIRDFDLENYLPGDLLRKVDTASMAVALEVRCPFLDRDLARAVLAMPIKDLLPGGKRKGLLRQIARKHLPADAVDRPKMGFAIPIGEWFRDDSLPSGGGGMKTLLLDHLNSTEPFGPIELNDRAVQRFIDEHMSGQRDHSHRLFTLLTLSIWAKQVSR